MATLKNNDPIETNEPTENNEDSDGSLEPEKPVVGMVFESTQKAREFYENYGRGLGFDIRIGGSYKTKRGDVYTRMYFVCSREGYAEKKVNESGSPMIYRESGSKRCGCKAMMRIQLQPSGSTWVIIEFRDTHNHAIITHSKCMFMKANRRVPDEAKELSDIFDVHRLQQSKIVALFNGDGPSGGFDSRDIYNHRRTQRKTVLQTGDAAAVVDRFERIGRMSSGFYWRAQLDEEGKLLNVFWVDARSRAAYRRFGEVITSDTTYRTNRYKLPFAPFTGVNHHWQCIMFGFALLQDETEDTFTWLFRTWLDAMDGRPPASIITDQDGAMAKAISTVFPNARHRLCIWHITKKFPEKLSAAVFRESGFKSRCDNLLYNTWTVAEFEGKWQEFLVHYNLEDNLWLQHLYSIREKWVPVYNRVFFFAGMNTTGRSESINAFFDNFVNNQTTLHQFVVGCEQAMRKVYMRERREDYDSIHKNRQLISEDPLVKHAAEIYTKTVFHKVDAEEFRKAARLGATQMGTDGDVSIFIVRPRVIHPDSHEFTVRINRKTYEGGCSCRKMEFVDLPCRHLFLVLGQHFLLSQFPPPFVNARWTKKANRSENGAPGISADVDPNNEGPIGSDVIRIANLHRQMMDLAHLAGPMKSTYKLVQEHITDLTVQTWDMIEKSFRDQDEAELNRPREEANFRTPTTEAQTGRVFEIGTPSSQGPSTQTPPSQGPPTQTPSSQGPTIRDPDPAVPKGRPKERRIRSGISLSQQQQKKPRACTACKSTSHDKRTCPLVKAQQQQLQTSIASQRSGTGSVNPMVLADDDDDVDLS